LYFLFIVLPQDFIDSGGQQILLDFLVFLNSRGRHAFDRFRLVAVLSGGFHVLPFTALPAFCKDLMSFFKEEIKGF
jgi:hypothetical protein